MQDRLDLVSLEKLAHIFQAASRQRQVLGVDFSAIDDPRLVVSREASRLGTVEFGILEGGQAVEAIAEGRGEAILSDVNLISKDHVQALGQRLGEGWVLLLTRGRAGPGRGAVGLGRGKPDTDNPISIFRVVDKLFDTLP